jgi:hypothetical protein
MKTPKYNFVPGDLVDVSYSALLFSTIQIGQHGHVHAKDFIRYEHISIVGILISSLPTIDHVYDANGRIHNREPGVCYVLSPFELGWRFLGSIKEIKGM